MYLGPTDLSVKIITEESLDEILKRQPEIYPLGETEISLTNEDPNTIIAKNLASKHVINGRYVRLNFKKAGNKFIVAVRIYGILK